MSEGGVKSSIPESERAEALEARLRAARDRYDSDLSRSRDGRGLDRVRILDQTPPVVAVSMDAGEGDLATVLVPLSLEPEVEIRPLCDTCDRGCAHARTALDELLDWLDDAESPRRAELLQAVGAPPWRRWLEDLDDALDALDAEARDRRSARLWWSVDLEKRDLSAHLQRIGDGGAPLAPKRIPLDAVEERLDLGPEDQIALASARSLRASRRAAEREGRLQTAFLEALCGLVDHPRVAKGKPGGIPWRVARLPVRLSVEDEGEALDLKVFAGPHPLTKEDVSARLGEGLLLVERPEEQILGVAKIAPPVRRLLQRWAKSAVPVPSRGAPELMARLSKAAAHLAVDSGDLTKEHQLQPRLDLVVLVTPTVDEGLHLDFRARPLEDGPLLSPGAGLPEVLAASPDRTLFRATRDLDAEVRIYRGLLREHGLVEVPDQPGHAHVSGLADALETLESLRREPRVELQWRDQKWSVPTEVDTPSLRVSIEAKKDWLDVHGGAVIDDRRLELAVLVEAARRDRGYVALDEGRFIRLTERLRDRLLELGGKVDKQGHLRVPMSGVERLRALTREVRVEQLGEAWEGLLARMDAAQTLEPKLPEHLRDVLRDYQRDGFVWMSRLAAWGAGAVLADDMGLGKTLQVIAMLCERASEGPQLVIAPTSVGFNWMRELARFAPALKAVDYSGSRRLEALERLGPGTVLVTSYGVILRDVTHLSPYSWTTLVLDEAQAIKNPKTRRARAVRKLDADWSVALTGTPMENHPSEVWALFDAVFPGLLGDWESFRVRYLPEADARSSFADAKDESPALEALGTGGLRQVIRPYLLRRTKAQVARELPPRTEMTIDVTLSDRERALYEDARLAAIAQMNAHEVVEDTHFHMVMFAALTRLRQLSCHPRLVDHRSRVPSSKLERFLQIMTDLLAEGRSTLVFSQMTRHLDLVEEPLKGMGIPFLRLDGSTPAKARQRAVDAFQAGEASVFLISTKAGGTGLNLTAADTVIHLDPWWNPAAEDQATDRAHRLGQDKPVTVLRLVSRETIEEKMLAMNADKRAALSTLLEDADLPARLTAKELRSLITGSS